jgi:AraC-like DNA-binding protein
MTIKHFDIHNGLYVFEESNLVSQLHKHPIVELIIAESGGFSLSTKEKTLKKIHFGLVKPNQWHLFDGSDCHFKFVFVECTPFVLNKILALFNVTDTRDGIVAIDYNLINHLDIDALQKLSTQYNKVPDERIKGCLNFIKHNLHQSKIPLITLARLVHLSPTRLSHLFCEQMGIPIQQYIIWERMKKTMDLVVKNNANLNEAAHSAGFYDAAHFSKHFKSLFGLNPSMVYNNSRIVQV